MNGGEVMAKQIEGVYDKLIECAKAEFLEKGFKDASLRTIAKNAAQVLTRSMYVSEIKQVCLTLLSNPIMKPL